MLTNGCVTRSPCEHRVVVADARTGFVPARPGCHPAVVPGRSEVRFPQYFLPTVGLNFTDAQHYCNDVESKNNFAKTFYVVVAK